VYCWQNHFDPALAGSRGAELTLHIFSKGCSAPFKFDIKIWIPYHINCSSFSVSRRLDGTVKYSQRPGRQRLLAIISHICFYFWFRNSCDDVCRSFVIVLRIFRCSLPALRAFVLQKFFKYVLISCSNLFGAFGYHS